MSSYTFGTQINDDPERAPLVIQAEDDRDATVLGCESIERLPLARTADMSQWAAGTGTISSGWRLGSGDWARLRTIEASNAVAARHNKAMPVILTEPEEWELWMSDVP